MGEEKAPVLFVPHVNNILQSFFSNVEVYINNQQIYNSNGFYVHNTFISNNFKRGILKSDYKGFSHCEGYEYQDFPDEFTVFFWTFFHRRVKLLDRP